MIHSSLIIINNPFHFCNPFCISNIKFYQMIHSSLTIMIHSSFEIYYVYCIVLIHCILSICLVFTVALLISHLVIQYNRITHSSLIIMNDPFQFCNPFCIWININYYQMIHSSLIIMIHSSFTIYFVSYIELIHFTLSICLVFHYTAEFSSSHPILSSVPFQVNYYDPFQFYDYYPFQSHDLFNIVIHFTY